MRRCCTTLGQLLRMASTLDNIAPCPQNTDMDKRSGFWQVDWTPNAQDLQALITPQGMVLKWKFWPFGVANIPAVFQKLMIKILSLLCGRPVVQKVI